MKNKITTPFILIACFLCFSGRLYAEPDVKERRIEQEKRQGLQTTEQAAFEEQRLVFDYGGWFNYRYDNYDEDDNDSSQDDMYDCTQSADIRLWFRLTLRAEEAGLLQPPHFFYFRLKDIVYTEREPKETAGGYDHDGPHVDYAYASFNAAPYTFEAGRKYFSCGRGIAYSDVHDGAELKAQFSRVSLKTFVSHSLPHEDNIDLSLPGYAKESDRYFFGTEAVYRGIPEQSLYAYALIQKDFSNEEPEDQLYDYTYDSQYYGIGAEGKLTGIFLYWVEAIRENGSSFILDTNEKKDVKAWAANAGLAYEPDSVFRPRFDIEYAFGSGDKDRVSVTDTQLGNTQGDDTNFLYFGYSPTGYALSPRLSNLYFYRVGFSLNPFVHCPALKYCRFGMDYYRYFKDKAAGGIYDLEATQEDIDIGYEIDATLSWMIFSDLLFVLEYGHFEPGDAYPVSANDNEDYFSASLIFTF